MVRNGAYRRSWLHIESLLSGHLNSSRMGLTSGHLYSRNRWESATTRPWIGVIRVDFEHKISAANLNLWGKVIDQTSSRQNFSIVIKGLVKKAIGDHIEELSGGNYSHSDIVLAQPWWLKMLYGWYSGRVATVVERTQSEGYTVEFEYSESVVFVHCKANSWPVGLGTKYRFL